MLLKSLRPLCVLCVSAVNLIFPTPNLKRQCRLVLDIIAFRSVTIRFQADAAEKQRHYHGNPAETFPDGQACAGLDGRGRLCGIGRAHVSRRRPHGCLEGHALQPYLFRRDARARPAGGLGLV